MPELYQKLKRKKFRHEIGKKDNRGTGLKAEKNTEPPYVNLSSPESGKWQQETNKQPFVNQPKKAQL